MSIINQAREVSRDVWESSVIHLLWCDKRVEKKWADLYLDDKTLNPIYDISYIEN